MKYLARWRNGHTCNRHSPQNPVYRICLRRNQKALTLKTAMENSSERIRASELAARLGCTRGAITLAIRRGRISQNDVERVGHSVWIHAANATVAMSRYRGRTINKGIPRSSKLHEVCDWFVSLEPESRSTALEVLAELDRQMRRGKISAVKEVEELQGAE